MKACERCHHGSHEIGVCVVVGCICNVGPWDRPLAPEAKETCASCPHPTHESLWCPICVKEDDEAEPCWRPPLPLNLPLPSPPAETTQPFRPTDPLTIGTDNPVHIVPTETPRMSQEEFWGLRLLSKEVSCGVDLTPQGKQALWDEANRARGGEQTLYRDLVAALAQVYGLKAEALKWEQLLIESGKQQAALKERAEKAWDEGHIAGVNEAPGYRENTELRDLLEKAEADAARLRGIIEKAPHEPGCPCLCDRIDCDEHTCWKAAALAPPETREETKK
jgi:hypothetical protein